VKTAMDSLRERRIRYGKMVERHAKVQAQLKKVLAKLKRNSGARPQ